MNELFRRGYNHGARPSGHVVSENWDKDNGGAIPGNVIEAANTRSDDPYIQRCRISGLEVHPARFAERVPEFFINFLTRPRNLVLDPFAGSNVVGYMAEKLKRRWISIEVRQEYVIGSAFRFDGIGERVLEALKKDAAGGLSIHETESPGDVAPRIAETGDSLANPSETEGEFEASGTLSVGT
jgi:hypothetical protein